MHGLSLVEATVWATIIGADASFELSGRLKGVSSAVRRELSRHAEHKVACTPGERTSFEKNAAKYVRSRKTTHKNCSYAARDLT
jgi:hypothetical protein